MSLWHRGWISVAVPECGKGLWQSKRPGSLTFRHGYKLQMRNEVKWFLSQILWCIFRLNCTYMTYDTWFMIYDTGCMIGDKYVYIYIETQIAARSKKTVDVSNGQAKASATSMEPVRLTIGEATALAKERVPWLMFAKGRVWFGVNDLYIYTVYTHQLDYSSCGMILEAAAILQRLRVFPCTMVGSDLQLGNPPKSQSFGAATDHLFQLGGRDPQVFQKRWSNLKNQRIFQGLSDQHPFKVNPNGQEIHGLRLNWREMFFLVVWHQNPQTQLTQSRQRWLRA